MIFMLRRGQFDGRVYNVLTLNATVTHVIEVLTTFVPDLRITYVDSPLMNDLSYCVDDQRFSRVGFEIRGGLEHGIGDTIAMLSARTASRHTPAALAHARPGMHAHREFTYQSQAGTLHGVGDFRPVEQILQLRQPCRPLVMT